MMTAYRLYEVLLAHPLPGSMVSLDRGGSSCRVVVGASEIRYGSNWLIGGIAIACLISGDATVEQVYSEIRRVLALGYKPSKVEIEERLVEEIDRRRDVEQALAKVTAERDHLLIAESTLSKIAAALAIPALAPHDDALSMVKRLVDGYTVVSQRLVGSQKEVAEVTERATKAEARVKRLLRQRSAAHAVLDEAGIGLEVEGSPRWTLARRCRAAAAPVWGYLDALQAFDVVGEIVGVTGKTGERGFIDAVIARVKALHQEDADLLRLVSYHQAPIKFNARPLTLAERASFVIRRLWQGRTNAANEAAALRRELGDIEAALGDLPDTAERDPIGDREEHLGLSTAERIRLSR